MIALTDEQLVRAMARGEQAAFEAFIHRYHAPLLGFVERMLRGDPQKAEDFVQETFVRLIRQLQKGRIPENIRSWLYRVAANLCKDYWKSSGYRAEKQAVDSGQWEGRDERASVLDICERQETRRELLHALNHLSDAQRQIVILRFYQDLKLQEIADIMDMTLSATKSSLYNGLKKLKRVLENQKRREQKEEEAHEQQNIRS